MSNVGGIAADRLRSFIERIERLEEEKAEIQTDIKEVYGEAKGAGFDVKIMRQIIRLRKMDNADREEQETVLGLYMGALGMDSTHLGRAAAERETKAHPPKPKAPPVHAAGQMDIEDVTGKPPETAEADACKTPMGKVAAALNGKTMTFGDGLTATITVTERVAPPRPPRSPTHGAPASPS